jgi:hypothetical protein
MHVAALPSRLGERFADRRLQPLTIVGDDELDAGEAARLKSREEIAPARPAFSTGELDRQDLAPRVKPVG